MCALASSSGRTHTNFNILASSVIGAALGRFSVSNAPWGTGLVFEVEVGASHLPTSGGLPAQALYSPLAAPWRGFRLLVPVTSLPPFGPFTALHTGAVPYLVW